MTYEQQVALYDRIYGVFAAVLLIGGLGGLFYCLVVAILNIWRP